MSEPQIVLTLHRFESGRDVVFADEFFWGDARIEDEKQSSIETADGGYAWLTGHPANGRFTAGGEVEHVLAYYGLEIDRPSADLWSLIWRVGREGSFALAQWRDPTKLVDFDWDALEHMERIPLDPPPIAVAVTAEEDATSLPSPWGAARVARSARELASFFNPSV